jgi:hypothetical protein
MSRGTMGSEADPRPLRLRDRPRRFGGDTGAMLRAMECTTETGLSHWTTSAVTIPYIPCGPSTCGRMWQWNAHAPG